MITKFNISVFLMVVSIYPAKKLDTKNYTCQITIPKSSINSEKSLCG